MGNKIKILIIEDNESDVELLHRELKKSELIFSSEIVRTQDEFITALDSFQPDIILSDYSLPSFDGVTAFQIKQKKYSDIPFIIVSGTIGEENAVELIKNGVTDYALKDKLFTLTPKINRALKETEEIKEKRIAAENLKIEHKKLMKAESQIRNFAKHLNQVLEEERAHIAREIHDDVGQRLAVIKMRLFLLKKIDGAKSISLEPINTMMDYVDETIQSLRKIATSLRPGILDALGLVSSIRWLTEEFEKTTDIKCHLQLDMEEPKFNKDISICYFRICQEALTNISKHSQASEVTIRLNKIENELILKISDNGKGIVSKKLENPISMGLIGMHERTNIIGGNLLIKSEKNSGTTLHLKANIN